ncbi:hypothetical protein BDZ94DRAFT_1370985 [Collybia nuda]|uniref:Uncharacterized protein n=1 Tax=Collybia nuda TaxID=64659 RepID=A0A9P5Y1M8_9AGAR|nr:hypothetical protein BDZ94DRAFT_1370985 [Collybia nuda]
MCKGNLTEQDMCKYEANYTKPICRAKMQLPEHKLNMECRGSKREVVFLHASFKNFIFNEGRSGQFYINHQKESLFIATKCLDYMGHLTEMGLNGDAIEYSWSSWSYHGEHAGDLYFHEVLKKLDNCDKLSWIKRFPADFSSYCADGLDSSIKWLQEIKWGSCERIIASLEAPLTVLCVFENLGFDFFDPNDDFLVVLTPDNMQLIPLYFWYSGKLYDLVERSQSRHLPSKIANRGKDICQHGQIALRSIHNLNHGDPTSVVGAQCAAKYWVKHVFLADPKDIKLIEELRQAISQRIHLDELDLLYQQVLNACPEKYRVTLLHVIGLLFLGNPAFEWTCDIPFIESILGLCPGEVGIALQRMHLILAVTVAGSQSTIKFLYPSFRDFIFSEARSGVFFIDRQMENLFLATKCISYLGHRTQVGLSSMSTNDEAIEYPWNSWFYHGLDSGIAWLEVTIRFMPVILKSNTSALLSELQVVKRELCWVLYTSVERTSPLQMLHMFADRGAEFFDYGENCVAIIRSLGEASTILYFRYNKEVHSLVDRNAIYTHPQGKERRGDGLISLLCIRQLTSTNLLPPVGLRYAVKYWTKHISLTDSTDGRVLDQLQQIQLRETPKEGQITPEDARTVI